MECRVKVCERLHIVERESSHESSVKSGGRRSVKSHVSQRSRISKASSSSTKHLSIAIVDATTKSAKLEAEIEHLDNEKQSRRLKLERDLAIATAEEKALKQLSSPNEIQLAIKEEINQVTSKTEIKTPHDIKPQKIENTQQIFDPNATPLPWEPEAGFTRSCSLYTARSAVLEAEGRTVNQPLAARIANLTSIVDVTGETSTTSFLSDCMQSVNPLYGSLCGNPFDDGTISMLSDSNQGSDSDSSGSSDEEFRSDSDSPSCDSATVTALDIQGELEITMSDSDSPICDSATVTALDIESEITMSDSDTRCDSATVGEEVMEVVRGQEQERNDDPVYGPETMKESLDKLKEAINDKFEDVKKLKHDVKHFEKFIDFQRVIAEVAQIEELFHGKCQVAECTNNRKITYRKIENGVLTISYSCPDGHSGMWHSSSLQGHKRGQRMFAISTLLSSSVLVTGNNFDKVELLFKFLNCAFVSKSTFNRMQSFYAVPAIAEMWKNMKDGLEDIYKNETVVLCGDGRMDSPGFSAKYCVYSIMEQHLGVILDMEIVDKREAGGTSTVMEKIGLKRLLERLMHKINIGELTTDASSTVIKLVRDLKGLHSNKLKQLVHSLDIWHKACKLTAKLTKAAKIKGNEDIRQWIEPIRNHFCHCAEIASGSENDLKNAWLGIVHHICGEHEWAEGKCAHGPLTELENSKKCLSQGSKSFKAVQDIILNHKWLDSLKFYVYFSGKCCTHLMFVLYYY
ncbi:hypothetical protein AC249_AIPGENE13315 [Exaiptasia diaphana]|nr:hypothetical protein AC249_AIPGENE13315 [Exaiptasia diaphana]